MSVVAKFRVSALTDFGYSREIKLTAVYEGSLGENEENKRFTKATPSGDIRMSVDNPYAYDQFKIGEEWYVHFDLAVDRTAKIE